MHWHSIVPKASTPFIPAVSHSLWHWPRCHIFFCIWHEGPRQFISRWLRVYLLLPVFVFIYICIPIILQPTYSWLSHNISQTFQWKSFRLHSRKRNYNNSCMNVVQFCHWAFYSKVMLSYANCQAWRLVI